MQVRTIGAVSGPTLAAPRPHQRTRHNLARRTSTGTPSSVGRSPSYSPPGPRYVASPLSADSPAPVMNSTRRARATTPATSSTTAVSCLCSAHAADALELNRRPLHDPSTVCRRRQHDARSSVCNARPARVAAGRDDAPTRPGRFTARTDARTAHVHRCVAALVGSIVAATQSSASACRAPSYVPPDGSGG